MQCTIKGIRFYRSKNVIEVVCTCGRLHLYRLDPPDKK